MGANREPLTWTVKATCETWTRQQADLLRHELGREPSADELSRRFEPRVEIGHGNMLVNNGLALIMNRLAGVANTQALDNTHTRIGIGDSSTGELVTQSDLQATTNRFFQVMDATYPTVSGGVFTARATYQGTDANYAWNEWGIDCTTGNAVAGTTVGTLVNRKVQAFSTKASGEVRQFTVTLTLS